MFDDYTNTELRDVLINMATAQAKLAVATQEDITFWQHTALGHLLIEAAKRLPPDPKWEDMP